MASATLALVTLAGGCAAAEPSIERAPSVRLRPADFPAIEVECRTEPRLAPGECEAWALTVLDGASGAVQVTAQLVLEGTTGPRAVPGACRATFRDRNGGTHGPVEIACHVPSGG